MQNRRLSTCGGDSFQTKDCLQNTNFFLFLQMGRDKTWYIIQTEFPSTKLLDDYHAKLKNISKRNQK